MATPYDHLRDDPDLAPLVAEHGELSLEPADDPFRRLVVSIVNQQLSTASAAAIRERLFDAVEVTPAGILAASDETMADCGLSESKRRYVRNVADHFGDGFSPDRYDGWDDDAVVDDLTQITGVGVWTAKMFLMFCLAREDVFPVEDLGIRRGMEALYGAGIGRGEMRETAENWRPYRSYASLYLWRQVD